MLSQPVVASTHTSAHICKYSKTPAHFCSACKQLHPNGQQELPVAGFHSVAFCTQCAEALHSHVTNLEAAACLHWYTPCLRLPNMSAMGPCAAACDLSEPSSKVILSAAVAVIAATQTAATSALGTAPGTLESP